MAATFLFRAEVVEIRRDGDRVTGVTLDDGREIDAPIVVNVAGPHSFVINRMAGVEDDDEGQDARRCVTRSTMFPRRRISTSRPTGSTPLTATSGSTSGPESGNHILIGSEDPECDPRVWVDDPDDYDRNVTEAQWEAQVYRLARRIPTLRIPHRAQGRRRPLRRLRRLDPDLRPLRPARLLHGDRDERQPVQERAGRRAR